MLKIQYIKNSGGKIAPHFDLMQGTISGRSSRKNYPTLEVLEFPKQMWPERQAECNTPMSPLPSFLQKWGKQRESPPFRRLRTTP